MARKQFVSSKKNAPSRAVSSKEAALHGRAGGAVDAIQSDRDDDDVSDDDSDSGSNSPGSPASSNGSSLFTSDEQDALDDTDARGSSADAELTGDAVAVEVVPASVGRGKQLRFPTVISRGKESRVFAQDSAARAHDDDDDDSGSDSDSLLSIASDEEDDATAQQQQQTSAAPADVAMADTSTSSSDKASGYPIKGARARKRHRPDSGYYKHMSTFVRDCLLSVRDGGEAADVLTQDAHDAFRRKLSSGAVERVTWKETVESGTIGATTTTPETRRESVPASESHRKEPRTHESKQQDVSVSSKPEDPRRPRVEAAAPKAPSSSASAPSTQTNGAATAAAATAAPSAELCASCKRKISDVKEPEKPKKSVTIVVPEPRTVLEPQGSFLIPPATTRDVARLRAEASKLLEEARALKHEGNRKGSAETGAAAQIAQGKCYLRSSAKFFQHALKYADLKAAYKDVGDERHARTCGEYCVTTLSQTTSLIESTVRTMQNAGSKRMVALGCKLASVMHLTIYRLQHLKLFSLYSDLFTPGRSPDTRQNGTPTPPTGASADSKETAVRAHLLKEMEHTLRGFDMWRRYESCKVVVLPRISNPATTDLSVLFEELESELGRA